MYSPYTYRISINDWYGTNGKPEFKGEEAFDNFVAKYRGYMRYSFGVSDWRGLVGSTGI